MADEERVLLRYDVDRASLSQATKSVADLKGRLGDISRANQSVETSAKAAGNALARAPKEAQQAFQQLRQDILQAAASVDDLNQKKIDISGAQGDISTATSSISSLAGNFGVDTGGLQLVSDLTGTIEYLGKFKQGIQDTGAVLQGMGGSIGTVANLGATAAAGLGATGAALGAIIAVVGPIALVVGAAGLAIKSFTDLVAAQAAAVDAAKAQLQGDTDLRISNAVAIKTASAESVRAQLEEQQTKLDIIRQDRAAREEQLRIVQEQYAALGESFDPAQRAALGQAGQVWQAEVERLAKEEQTLAASIKNTTDVLLPEINAREREENTIRALADVEQKREQVLKTITQLETQRAQIASQASNQSDRTDEDRRIQKERLEEDYDLREIDQAAEHRENLLRIETSGQERLAGIRQQGINKLAQIDSQIGKLSTALEKANKDFMAAQRKSVEKLATDLRRLDEQANKARIRRLEDLNDDLAEAEASNDVNRFIAAQKQGDKDLSRMKEDADAQTQARMEQYAEERALADEQRQARIADIQAQMAEQQTMRQQVQADIAAQLLAEQTRIAAEESAAQAAFDKAQQRETAADALRQKRAQEDQQLADDRRKADLTAQLKAIDDKIKAEAQAAGIINAAHIAAATQGAAQVVALYKQAFNSLSINSSGSFGSSKPSGGSSGGLKKKIAFGYGGVADRPTDAVLGERPGWGDVVLPYQKSAGVESAFAGVGQSAPVFHFGSIDLGGISRDEFNAGMEMFAGKVVAGVQMAVGGQA